MDIRYFGQNARLSEAVAAGGLVFLSGMVPENPEEDVRAQTQNVLAQIDDWLGKSGSDRAHILEATVFLADMKDYAAMNEAWDDWVIPERTPARVCVQALLADRRWAVEIKVTAVQPR